MDNRQCSLQLLIVHLSFITQTDKKRKYNLHKKIALLNVEIMQLFFFYINVIPGSAQPAPAIFLLSPALSSLQKEVV
jgi:hypothetical protein